MQILNIAGYKFIHLDNLSELRSAFIEQRHLQQLKGTILLSTEGINLNLAGKISDIATFKAILKTNSHFADMTFRESYSNATPFKRLKVKLRKEIITLRRPEIRPDIQRAPTISPQELKQWLDEKRDIVVLDTRNDYEVRFGTFVNAVNLNINDFCEFPNVTKDLPRDKPIVMFCTGGIRCEKAGLHLQDLGFPHVYQLDGGILNYFTEVGGAHYQGECFVFDERVALNADLLATGTAQCCVCQDPIPIIDQTSSSFVPDASCPACTNYQQ